MFVAKKYFEVRGYNFKKGDEVPSDIAKNNARYVQEVKGSKGSKKVETTPVPEAPKEELLTEAPQEVEVEVEKPKKNKNKKKFFGSDED